jgi:RNA polymerase sigma-70 factor (ECF subfamily)
VDRAERAVQVQRALLTLSFAHRAVLLLRDAEGLSCEAVAEALSLPVGTVKSRLARAREALRARLLPAFTGAEGGRS